MHSSSSPANHDVDVLLTRLQRQRQRLKRLYDVRSSFCRLFHVAASTHLLLRSLPHRLILHLFVSLFVLLAAVIGTAPIPFGSQITQQSDTRFSIAEEIPGAAISLAPLSIDIYADDDQPVPDSAFAEIDALPVSPFNPALLAIQPVPALIAVEIANVRNGPGIEYGKIATLNSGAPLRLLARWGDWYKAQVKDGQIIWVAGELLDLDFVAAEFLPEATNIPAPPPPKVGLVMEEGLNLRDGPSTGYIGMAKLPAGTQIELLARYQEWFQVQAPDGQIGWVTGAYLAIGDGIVERVEIVTQIPDPNPPLIGMVRESRVNLRGGPDTAYEKIGVLGANVQLDLLARYQDWFKIRTPRGTEGWVSHELLDVRQFVARRVPQATSIPALPRAVTAAPRTQADAGIRVPIQFAPASAANGPVQFALQFVGARYVWGGASPESGFDCSGFTKYVYAQFGVNLPHSSVGQYSTRYGAPVSNPADLQPGDIVFFVNTYRRGISHVGIYVGGGDVVQALTPGRGVGIANLNQRYWAARYYGAIRPSR